MTDTNQLLELFRRYDVLLRTKNSMEEFVKSLPPDHSLMTGALATIHFCNEQMAAIFQQQMYVRVK